MPFPPRLIILLCLAASPPAQADHAAADRIEKTWDLEKNKWELAMATADTPEARAKAAAARPDLAPFVKDVWTQIGSSLDQKWTLPHIAWFLRAAPAVFHTDANGVPAPIFAKELETVRAAVEKHHLTSPDLAPVCMALASMQDPRSLAVLKKIAADNPSQKIQGVASLSCAMVMKSLGDDPALMRDRLNLLRDAIIKSSDVDLGGIPVSRYAEDELYIIRYLTKGRVAPDLTGANSAGQPMKLSDYQGKVIVLLFWGSNVLDAENTVRITNELARKSAGKPLVVLGVNKDPAAKLAALEADGTVTWKNFSDSGDKLAREYRIGTWPLVYVLDAERKIQYAGPPGSFAELTASALLAGMPANP